MEQGGICLYNHTHTPRITALITITLNNKLMNTNVKGVTTHNLLIIHYIIK